MVWSAIPLERTSFHKWAPVYNYTASPLTLINNTYLVCSWDCWESFITGYPTPGPVLVYGLLGTRPHSRRWKDSKQGKIHLYVYPLPIACITTWVSPPALSVEKLFSMKSVPGVKKVGDSCFTTQCEHSLQSTVEPSKGTPLFWQEGHLSWKPTNGVLGLSAPNMQVSHLPHSIPGKVLHSTETPHHCRGGHSREEAKRN